ncbi:Hypothetical_protein [Hexamita inflata]|uniref:Hypothetical_protein n=1 Tax=Hexamita inflata TaxID=28002 RepID=A0AA86TMM8_9EUKA|nr:Hypothetical protein HINF_LOCUS9570 [Hexamita inflata]
MNKTVWNSMQKDSVVNITILSYKYLVMPQKTMFNIVKNNISIEQIKIFGSTSHQLGIILDFDEVLSAYLRMTISSSMDRKALGIRTNRLNFFIVEWQQFIKKYRKAKHSIQHILQQQVI